MNIIYMLLSISVVVALIFFIAFIISVRKGQFDDTYTPAIRMLFEDELVQDNSSEIKTKCEEPITNSKK